MKNLGKSNGNMQQIVGLLKEKLGDWFINLSDEERVKYGDLNINTLVDQLMSADDPEAEENNHKTEKRKKINADKNDRNDQKTDSSKFYQKVSCFIRNAKILKILLIFIIKCLKMKAILSKILK